MSRKEAIKMPSKFKRFEFLRKKYPIFSYDDYDWKISGQLIKLAFNYSVGEINFNPKSSIRFPKGINLNKLSKTKLDIIENLVFNIGLVEMISYWKATCSPIVNINRIKLSKGQENWWRKLFYNGLGEFLYLNKIQCAEKDLLRFRCLGGQKLNLSQGPKLKASSILVPIGGGKDSLASVEVLKKHRGKKYFLLMNPTKASKDSAKLAADKISQQAIYISRKIDPTLLTLNSEGYLNGHTPFSAMLAFYCSLSALMTGSKYSVLSNESSANEPTIIGTNINHQYSKSYEFEKDFNSYLNRYISKEIEYLSLLRPLNEFQIVGIFSQNPKNLKVFKSCNVGSKKDIWCCDCSKCLFVFILLSTKIGIEKCSKVFGENLFTKKSLKKTFVELIGRSKTKPFECIGTIDEVNAALSILYKNEKEDFENLFLLRHYKNKFADAFLNDKSVEKIKSQFDKKNRIPNSLKKLLKDAHEKANK